MPVVLLERLPLPSLRTYTSVSVVLLACAVYYASQVVYERQSALEEAAEKNDSLEAIINGPNNASNVFDTGQAYLRNGVEVLLEETWCVWTLINMAYCCLILFGKVIQGAVFGELRVSEQQHVKDKFWNFVFYKFIFIFGVMNVQHMDEVMMWSAWFSGLGFLHLLSQLCKDRFEYLSFSPTTPAWTHAKVLLLLISILAMLGALFVICFFVGFIAGINIFAFMIAECALLAIKTLYVVVRYAIHLWDLHHDGVWENRALYVYWSEFTCEIGSLAIDFSHHLHMLVWSNIFLSMASLVICMQLRYLFHEGQRRLRRHKNYLRVVNSMQARFPMASAEEMEANNDDCAICWDRMESARKLPCSHLFHDSCLRSWLEQDTSCPTCRTSLSDPQDETAQTAPPGVPGMMPGAQPPPGEQERNINHTTTNHFFHFDGSRYVSWFPSFSVEVTHTPILGNGPPAAQVQSSQLDNMARDVQSVFPSMPLNVITEDLQVTRSVELTIENILEGVLVAPPTFPGRGLPNTNPPSDSTSPQQSSSTFGAGDGPLLAPPPLMEDAPGPSGISETPAPSDLPATSSTIPGGAMGGGDWAADNVVMSSNNNINFITDENLPDLESDSEDIDGRYEAPSPSHCAGYRFSKSPVERHSMLMQRKMSLVEHARKKYLMQHIEGSSDSGGSSDSEPCAAGRDALSYHEDQADLDSLGDAFAHHSESDRRLQRELAYRAAQKRMQQRPT